jgi:ubiquinone/menaquinone biosynthesis C-methylase UbiE
MDLTTPRKDLLPPHELIDSNNIGIADRENVLIEFDRVGRGIAYHMASLGYITPASRILDVGCGLARVGRAFVGELTTGTYTGLDVVQTSIDWCTSAYRDHPNFRFVHADVFSTFYNPDSKSSVDDYRFPFENGSFDFILSTSLFTHIPMKGTENYLAEMSRVLRPGGVVWNTYYLLDEVSEPLAAEYGRGPVCFPNEMDGGRCAHKENPEIALALQKDRVLAAHARFGLEPLDILIGAWSGRTDTPLPPMQDVIIARKAMQA